MTFGQTSRALPDVKSTSVVIASATSHSRSQKEFREQKIEGQLKWSGLYLVDENFEIPLSFYAKSRSTSTTFDEFNRSSDKSKTELGIVDAYGQYVADKWKIGGFIANQKRSQVFSKLSDRGNLTALEELLFLGDRSSKDKFGLSGFQSQLNGYESANGTSRLPYLGSETLFLNLEVQRFAIEARLTHFSLQNANGELAYNSAQYGNSTVGQTKESSFFTHEFEGYSAALVTHDIKVHRDWRAKIYSEYLRNEKGQKSDNQALIVGVGLKNKRHLFEIEQFEIGEQTLPAALLNSAESFVNAKGTRVSYEIQWRDFTFEAEWTGQKPIVNKLGQADEQIVYINVEKAFEIQ